MFVINPNRLLNLHEYGIQIPLLDKRFILCSEWVYENVSHNSTSILDTPLPLTDDELRLCHDETFIGSLKEDPEKEIMKTFELMDSFGNYNRYTPETATRPLDEMVNRISSHIRGSILTCEMALKHDFSFFLGGGLHHSMSFGGRGFCLINDIVLSIRLLQQKKLIKSAWVIDIDAHKGDGTAELTQNDDSIITMSMHMKSGWPLVTPRYDPDGKLYPWYIASDLDIEISSDNEKDYNLLLKNALFEMKEKYPRPDLVVINCGSDPFIEDELESAASIKLSLEQMKERDFLVYSFFKEWNIPQAYLMSGGYGQNAHKPYIEFFNTLKDLKAFECKSK